jgi:hypothetical protein
MTPDERERRRLDYQKISSIRRRMRSNKEVTDDERQWYAAYMDSRVRHGRPALEDTLIAAIPVPIPTVGSEQQTEPPPRTFEGDAEASTHIPGLDVNLPGSEQDKPPPKDTGGTVLPFPPRPKTETPPLPPIFNFEEMRDKFSVAWGEITYNLGVECDRLGGFGIPRELIDALIVPATKATFDLYIIPKLKEQLGDSKKAAPVIAIGPTGLLYVEKRLLLWQKNKEPRPPQPPRQAASPTPPPDPAQPIAVEPLAIAGGQSVFK